MSAGLLMEDDHNLVEGRRPRAPAWRGPAPRTGIAVCVHPAGKALKMCHRMRRLAVGREAVPGRRWRLALPGPLVLYVGPGPAGRLAAGNAKLSKGSQDGRRVRALDDAAAAAILAVAEGARNRIPPRRRWRYGGLAG